MRSFIKHQRRLNRRQVFQTCSPRVRSRGKKTREEELIRWQPRGDKRRHESRRTRNWYDCNSALNRRVNDAKSRVAYQRRAGVRYDGDTFSLFKQLGQSRGAFPFVVFVVTNGPGPNTEVIQQNSSAARVFAGNYLDIAQHAQRSLRDVFEISDWGGDNVERSGHVTRIVAHVVSEPRAASLGTQSSRLLVRAPMLRLSNRDDCVPRPVARGSDTENNKSPAARE